MITARRLELTYSAARGAAKFKLIYRALPRTTGCCRKKLFWHCAPSIRIIRHPLDSSSTYVCRLSSIVRLEFRPDYNLKETSTYVLKLLTACVRPVYSSPSSKLYSKIKIFHTTLVSSAISHLVCVGNYVAQRLLRLTNNLANVFLQRMK